MTVAAELRAIPDVLAHVGTELTNHGQALEEEQRACHRDADDAQRGWVGASASALAELLNRWALVGDGHHARLAGHADGMRYAAATLREMEQSNAAALR
ncbi:WXG100 family type VII secretion target [Mycobacterium camsae]|uniref:WXG100 family type VII secretion target n=1 Tax=Mycobacterium gordonae TaxID=1778 RepID=UPI0019815235|nr:WXG100 family type VII secretion target [Mycobacterium gordonae]